MLAVQTDIYSAFAHYLAKTLVAAYDNKKATNPALTSAIALLRSWNGQMNQDQAGPLIVTLAFQHVRRAMAESASKAPSTYDIQMAPAVMEKLLRTRPGGWFADYDETLLKGLAGAVEEGQRMQGPKLDQWKYGTYTEITINNPVLHNVPLVGKYFDIGPAPMSGSSTTVKQLNRRLGPSMRMSVDFSDLDHSLLNVPIGQSGQILSSHYRDEWEHYYFGQSYPMQFRNVGAKSTLRLTP